MAFGRPVAEQGATRERIAEARCRIDMARAPDAAGGVETDVAGKGARAEIAIVAPARSASVIDWAIRAHGGGGPCEDFPLV